MPAELPSEQTSSPRRIAVVLFNLGGPDRPEAVRPFLFNLFADKSILRVPSPVRPLLASLISRRRAPEAGRIYDRLGGGSPLLENTKAQARALEAALNSGSGEGTVFRTFIAMRYWHPMSPEVAAQVAEWGPDEVLLLPLYPQFSSTTTASSRRVWGEAARFAGLEAPTRLLCCYPTEEGFVEASARRIAAGLARAAAHGTPRLLFSAHGLPKRVVEAGDPYQWQCEETARAIAARLAEPDLGWGGLDWVVCYQSRVGPLEWIGPSTESEVIRAGADGVPLVIVPVAFVSEHSETLVEIEIEYRHLAAERGVPQFERVETVGADDAFIAGLAAACRARLAVEAPAAPASGRRLCPAGFRDCPCPAA